jgi:hypothetical protein
MGIVDGLVLILLGALCIPSLIAQKIPNTKALLNKAVPFQGVFGIILIFWSIWVIIEVIRNIEWIGMIFPFGLIFWITILVDGLLSLLGGAILGWGLIQKYLLEKASENVKTKAEASFAKVIAFQPKIGIAAIIFGIWVIISDIVIF